MSEYVFVGMNIVPDSAKYTILRGLQSQAYAEWFLEESNGASYQSLDRQLTIENLEQRMENGELRTKKTENEQLRMKN